MDDNVNPGSRVGIKAYAIVNEYGDCVAVSDTIEELQSDAKVGDGIYELLGKVSEFQMKIEGFGKPLKSRKQRSDKGKKRKTEAFGVDNDTIK